MTDTINLIQLQAKTGLAGALGSAASAISTHSGLYQYTDTDWLAILYQLDSTLLHGYTDQDITANPALYEALLLLKSQSEYTDAAIDLSLENHTQYLIDNDLAVTSGNLFACHIFGTAGAQLLLTNGSQLVTTIVDKNLQMVFKQFIYNVDGSIKTADQCLAAIQKTASSYIMADSQQAGTGTASLARKTNPNPSGHTSCQGQGISSLALLVKSGLLQGQGLAVNHELALAVTHLRNTQITGAFADVFGIVADDVLGISYNLLAGMSSTNQQNIISQLAALGSDSSASITGVLPASITNVATDVKSLASVRSPLSCVIQNLATVTTSNQQFVIEGGLVNLVSTVADNAVAKNRTGGVERFIGLMNQCNGISTSANQIVAAASEALGQTFGNGPGGIGANYRNMNDLISFGISTISRDMSGASIDFINMGRFNLDNYYRIQAPGSVAAQIIARGLGITTGLIESLVSNGVPVAGVDNPKYDVIVQKLLNSVNDAVAVNAVAVAFNIGIHITSLGMLTDISIMMPTVAKNGNYQNFNELGKHLLSLNLTRVVDFQTLGESLAELDCGIELNHLSQLDTPIHKPSADVVVTHYGFGGGTFGEITMADFIGTAAGYVHVDSFNHIINYNNILAATVEGKDLIAAVNILHRLLLGYYTVTLGSVVYAPPGVGTYTTAYPACVACIENIANKLLAVEAITDVDIVQAKLLSETAHAASAAQILKENLHLKKFKLSLFDHSSATPLSITSFVQSLSTASSEMGYGRIGEYLNRVASDDLYGDAVRAVMKQAKNAQVLKTLGVPVNQQQLPNSQYYRDPTEFYKTAYTGNLPMRSRYQMDPLLPATAADAYVDYRNSTLVKNGVNPYTNLPAQADQAFMDINSSNISSGVREQIGLSLLKQVVDRNIRVTGTKLTLTDLNGDQIDLGSIEAAGLNLNTNSGLVIKVITIVNKLIYGNIGITKNSTPFATHQMVYGMIELLAQVTPDNIDSLRQTLLGQYALDGLLSNIQSTINSITAALDTRMDRNDPTVWGDSGPADKIKLT